MPRRTELERSVQPSLLERLTDLEPNRTADGPTNFESSARAFRDSVQRDVEWLLNTRRSMIPVPDAYVEVARSVFTFGLPDTSGLAVGTAAGRRVLLSNLQETVTRFEPRLGEPQVRLVDATTPGALPLVRFTVAAILRMDPSPEHVVFDTVLEMASGVYEVDAESDGASR